MGEGEAKRRRGIGRWLSYQAWENSRTEEKGMRGDAGIPDLEDGGKSGESLFGFGRTGRDS